MSENFNTGLIGISAPLDGGNIVVGRLARDQVDLEIAKDHGAEYFQWFYFEAVGIAGREVTYRLTNAGQASYPQGWVGYQVCWSTDRKTWRRVADTTYADGVLTWRLNAPANNVWFAYFAPFSMERHHDLVASAARADGVVKVTLGRSIDDQPIDCLRVGEGPLQVWLFARQHPGETMAEWWMEGALEVLVDPASVLARKLRQAATFHIVPNMNPDGSRRGHLRANAVGIDLNREWAAPSPDRSPEVLAVLEAMDRSGVDFALDVHGDEALPYVFLAGFEGTPSWRPEQAAVSAAYTRALLDHAPDFQTEFGYPRSAAGKANLSLATKQLAERFGTVSMTLEMPFKDNDNRPSSAFGWSPERSRALARACLQALGDVTDNLAEYRKHRLTDNIHHQ
jgi:murein tripeptide amidase MpaA